MSGLKPEKIDFGPKNGIGQFSRFTTARNLAPN